MSDGEYTSPSTLDKETRFPGELDTSFKIPSEWHKHEVWVKLQAQFTEYFSNMIILYVHEKNIYKKKVWPHTRGPYQNGQLAKLSVKWTVTVID